MHDYSSLVKIFEDYLNEHQPIGEPDTLYEPIRYINELGGKRIRPVLLLMAYNIWHDVVTPALPAAMAMEYFHNFSLMHDDIMDEAPLRRGQESIHLHFGRNAAILSGDALLIKSFDLLIELENKYRLGSSIALVMAKASLEICEGQQMDIDFETKTSLTETEYLEMIRKKTACLLGACLKIGALIAGASIDIAGKLYSCGENIGIAFQIRDDILDVFGDSAITGKQRGGDILRGKKNFLYVRSFNSLSSTEQNDFSISYSQASEKGNIATILEIYQSLNVEEYAQEMQNHYFNDAMNCLDHISSVNSVMLKSFALELMSRDH